MEKIKINIDLFEKLNNLCQDMEIPPTAHANLKMAEHLRQLHHLGHTMGYDLNDFTDRVDDILNALYEKDFVEGIEFLSKAVKQTAELQETLTAISDELACSLAALRNLIEPDTWKPLCTDEEIKEIIDNGFSVTNSVTMGYDNGQYALIFEESEDDESPVLPPYVVALGGDDDSDAVRAYIEQFMDMEEV